MSAQHAVMAGPGTAAGGREAFRHPFTPLGGRYVYAVVSPRARGLSLGINLNPGKYCNFDCVYCEVDRSRAVPVNSMVDANHIALELEQALKHIHDGRLSTRPEFRNVSPDLLQLKHVTLSGEGEPTLCPNFHEVVETVIHLRASARVPFFKLVLVTNASGLDRAEVAYGVSLLARRDEIWAKLDAGTQSYMDRINKAETSLSRILENIRGLARRRPVVIQTMVPAIDGRNPFDGELSEFIARLNELKSAGAQIALVQIYSATRPSPHSECGHLPLMTLSEIAKQVRAGTGLRTEVF